MKPFGFLKRRNKIGTYNRHEEFIVLDLMQPSYMLQCRLPAYSSHCVAIFADSVLKLLKPAWAIIILYKDSLYYIVITLYYYINRNQPLVRRTSLV